MRQLVSSSFRSQSLWALTSFLFLGLVIAGCGHKTTTVPTTISITPATSVSLQFGQVQELSAQVTDNNGNVLTDTTFVWTSSNSNIATVTATGGECGDTTNSTSTSCICAGTWSSNFITCQNPPPGAGTNGQPQSGTATITVTSSGLSATITVLVHPQVARVSVSPANVDCLSATGTQQLTPTAYDGQGNNITNLVAIDASSFSWSSSDGTVVSIDTNGLATAVNPGRAQVYAAIAGTSSPPASFTTCPVVSITLAVSGGSGNTFSIAQAATQQLTPTVIDSNNNTITITSGRLAYNANYSEAISVDDTGLATGLNPGNSAIVASCSPPSCNNGLYPVYSNVIVGNTQGTTASGTNASTTQVLVAATDETELIPVDITTATVGTTVTLPYAPNSLVYSRAAAVAYMGSNTELMSYSYGSATASAVALLPGVIVSLSNAGDVMVIYDSVGQTVTVFNTAGTIIDKFSVPNATPTNVHAATSPDDQTTLITVGSQLFVSTTTSSLRTITLNAPANDVAYLQQGSFAYLAGGETNSITARTTCDSSERDVVAVPAIPDRIIGSSDGTKVYALQGSVMDTVTATTTGAGCPPALTDALSSVDLGQGTVSPTQIFTDQEGLYVYMISSSGNIVVYSTTAASGSSISLVNGAEATTGALTMDGQNLWVGDGNGEMIHRIDTSTASDAQQIKVPIPADLVAVRYE